MGSVIRVTKEFDFEMAHALLGYDGPCKNIHGHSYKLKVTIRGKVKEFTDDSDEGMVMDFGDLKTIVNKYIVHVFDHALVLNDKMELKEEKFEFMEKLILVPFQPTCEKLLVHFSDLIRANLPEHLSLRSLLLRETSSSYAEWHAEDN